MTHDGDELSLPGLNEEVPFALTEGEDWLDPALRNRVAGDWNLPFSEFDRICPSALVR